MRADGREQVARAAVVQEEQTPAEPPERRGAELDGSGGARTRMNAENLWMSLVASPPVPPSATVVPFGVVAYWQPAVSSRSVGKRSLLPSARLGAASAAALARIVASGVCSIRPPPNTGVGMRTIASTGGDLRVQILLRDCAR